MIALVIFMLGAAARAADHRFPDPIDPAACARALANDYRPRITADAKSFGELILWVAGRHPAYRRARARAASHDAVDQLPLGFSRPRAPAAPRSRWLGSGREFPDEAARERLWAAFTAADRETPEFRDAAVGVLHNVVTLLDELGRALERAGDHAGARTPVKLAYTIRDPGDAGSRRAVDLDLPDHFAAADLARVSDLARVARLPSVYPALFAALCVHRDELAADPPDDEFVTPAAPAGAGALARLRMLTARFERRDDVPDHRALAVVNHVLVELGPELARGVAWGTIDRAHLNGAAFFIENHAALVEEDARIRAVLEVLRAAVPVLGRAAEWAKTAAAAAPAAAVTERAVAAATAAVRSLIERRAADAQVLDLAVGLSSVVALRELFGPAAIDEDAVDRVFGTGPNPTSAP